MTPIIEKYIDVDKLQEVIQSQKFEKEILDEFINHLDHFLSGLEKDDAIFEEDTFDDLTGISLDYIGYYAKRWKEGYSVEWSRKYARSKVSSDTSNLLMYCYEAVQEQSEQAADADLKTYFKLTNRSQLFIDYFRKRMDEGESFTDSSIEKDVERFELSYYEQINQGKSELYAYQYADYLIDDYHPIFCEDYAYIYEESINNGKSEEYARTYAYRYASNLIDVKRRYGISDDEDSLNFAKAKAKAFINGWEYAQNNKLDDSSRFISIYENAYLNTYYSDNKDEWATIEECERIAIEKAVGEYTSVKS